MQCGAVCAVFLLKTANCIALCCAVRCNALLFVVRYSYTILWAILVWFLWFNEHPYMKSF